MKAVLLVRMCSALALGAHLAALHPPQALAANLSVISPENIIRSYSEADVVFVGDVISCSTELVQDKRWQLDGAWIYHHQTLRDSYTVKVVTMVKGMCRDSVIVVESQRYGGVTEKWRNRFLRLDDRVDSMFVCDRSLIDGGDHPRYLKVLNRYILLVKNRDSSYVLINAHEFDDFLFEFYRKLGTNRSTPHSRD